MIDYVAVGKKIKNARLSHNLTQTELANEIGVSTGYMCQIENGDKCFNLNRLDKVADFFEKPITYFINDTDGDFRTTAITEISETLRRMPDEKLEKTKKILEVIAE